MMDNLSLISAITNLSKHNNWHALKTFLFSIQLINTKLELEYSRQLKKKTTHLRRKKTLTKLITDK